MTRRGKALPLLLAIATLAAVAANGGPVALAAGSGDTGGGLSGAPAAAGVELHLAVSRPAGSDAFTVEVALVCQDLPAGPVEWRLPVGAGLPPAGTFPAEARLSDASGDAVPVTNDGWSFSAELPGSGTWSLNYTLDLGPAAGDRLLLRPAGLTVLPGGPVDPAAPAAPAARVGPVWVEVAVAAPDGWCVVPDASRALDRPLPAAALPSLLVLVAPSPPLRVDQAEVGPAMAGFFAVDPDGIANQAAVNAARTALLLFNRSLGRQVPGGEINVFLAGRDGPAEAAVVALDAAWLQTVAGLAAPPGGADGAGAIGLAPEDAAFLCGGLWPLARHSLLTSAGLVTGLSLADEATLATALGLEAEAYTSLVAEAAADGTTPPPPAEGAPLCSAFLMAQALGTSPEGLLRQALTLAAGYGGGSGLSSGAGPNLVAGLAPPDLAPRLLSGSQLPDLPPEIAALAEPEPDGISVVVGGTRVRFDVPPAVIGGRIMVPLRFLAERLGFSVSWDQAAGQALVGRNDRAATFPVGVPWYLLGGEVHPTDAMALIIDGRVLVPLRYAAQALDVYVAWDQATRTATVDPNRPYPTEGDSGLPSGNGDRVAYLTFDDGPNPSMTPRVLDVLAAKDVHATFFVIGSCAARYPDLLRQIVAGGHGLGNHTYSHNMGRGSEGWVYRSPEAYLAELASCDAAIAAATGLHPRVTRPPGGSYPYLTQEFKDALAAAGYVSYDWDASAADSAMPRPTAEQITARIAAAARPEGPRRLVILMHDGGGDHETTLEAVPLVIDLLRQLGYTFGTLG